MKNKCFSELKLYEIKSLFKCILHFITKSNAMDVSRAILDNLMGRDRNKPMDLIT